MITLTMLLVSSAISIFMFLCVARIVVSWFVPAIPRVGKLESALAAGTDWYLKLFSRISFLRWGRFDFAPAFGVLVLVLPSTALWSIGRDGRLDLGALLAVFLTSLWTAVAFLLGTLILLLILRMAIDSAGRGRGTAFHDALESLTDPLVFRANRAFFRGRAAAPRKAMLAALLALSGALALGFIVVWLLARLLSLL